MHRAKINMDKIAESNDIEKIKEKDELFYIALYELHLFKPEKTKWIKYKLAELANGKVFTMDQAEEVICKLANKKWAYEDTEKVRTSMGYICDSIDFYISANVAYEQLSDILSEDDILKVAHKMSKSIYDYVMHMMK